MSYGLGDSIRRRGRKRSPKKAQRTQRPSGTRLVFPGWSWVLAGLLVMPVGFAAGYYVVMHVIFPTPVVAESGIVVPDLLGLSVNDAERQLAGVGLVPGDISRISHPRKSPGTVIAQTPLAGQQLPAGLGVNMAISSGRPQGRVPDLVGFPKAHAEDLATRIGFDIDSRRQEALAPAGQVIEIEPPPGTTLELPAQIRLVVSTGPPPDTLGVDTLQPPLPDTLDVDTLQPPLPDTLDVDGTQSTLPDTLDVDSTQPTLPDMWGADTIRPPLSHAP